ncbi:MAG: preprotein translocase subunit SecY [Planctomycetota bacterium]|nr:MAG: preprotein translocase subunit SecY [Planctomycetota bacterium]
MNSSAFNIVRIPELRKKLLLTLGLLLVYRVGFHVPLPGVNIEALQDAADQSGALGQIFGILSAVTGSRLGSAMLFSLGVMPYISASIIFSLLTKVVPSLEKLSKEGASGQRKINQYTRLATVAICFVQSFFVIGYLAGSGGSALVDPSIASWPYYLGVMVALTASTLFIMWLGEQITEHGIGNGISIIIMAGIIATVPTALVRHFRSQLDSTEQFQQMLLYAVSWVLIILGIVFITKGQRRIPIQQAKLTRGTAAQTGQRHFFPFKVNSAGVMPIIFASALMIVPSLLEGMGLGWFHNFRQQDSFWYIVLFSTLIIFFAFFWVQMMFQPTEIANNLREYGSFIPGIRPGKKTADYLGFVISRVTLAGSVFLCIVAVLPNFVTSGIGLGANSTFAYFLGGTSILIVVEVALDMVEKLNAHLVMRNYEGFMDDSSGNKQQRGTGGVTSPGWGRRSRSE